jgi:hypothetical protein
VRSKHNKKRNTAFLYEVLTTALTKSIIDKNAPKKRFVSALIKENFGKGMILGSELQHYQALLETSGLEIYVAEKLLQETKRAYSQLNSKRIFDSQTKIINKINKTLSKEAWNTFVPNFKSLATVDAIFNISTPVKQRVLHEDVLLKLLQSPQKLEENRLQPMDNIIYNSFVKKFNEKYGTLLREQKDLLGKYISSFADNGLELKLYLNEEVGRLKTSVEKSLKLEEIYADENMVEKTKKVLGILEEFKSAPPTSEVITRVLQVQQLVREIQSND